MNTELENLNQILIGEHMAIQKYQSYINSIADSPLRNHLIAMITDHKNNATRIAYFIQMNGGYVSEGRGPSGLLSSIESSFKKIYDTPIKMIDELIVGESKGLDKTVEIMEHLSASEREVVQTIIADSQEHIIQLKRLKEDLLM